VFNFSVTLPDLVEQLASTRVKTALLVVLLCVYNFGTHSLILNVQRMSVLVLGRVDRYIAARLVETD